LEERGHVEPALNKRGIRGFGGGGTSQGSRMQKLKQKKEKEKVFAGKHKD